jgi:signal transduction histidine kinase/peroxiredoxin
MTDRRGTEAPMTGARAAGLVSAAERAMVDAYDAQRRLALLRVMVPGLLVVTLAALPFAINSDLSTGTFSSTLQIGVGLVAFALAFWGIRTQRVNLASYALFAGISGVIVLLILYEGLVAGALPLAAIPDFALLALPIVLAGLLIGPWSAVLAMVVAAVFTMAIVLLTPHDSELRSLLQTANGLAVFTVPISLQLAIGVLMLAATRGYRRMQHELGNIRVAYARERELEQLKDQFITHINHELRTPIMTLDGYVEVLHTARARMSEQEQEEALAQASRTGKALVNLLESILEVRRIDETAVFEPQIVEIADALDLAQTLLDPRDGGLARRDLHVDVPAGLAVWGEPVRVQQILTNLLSNAIKYSPAGTPLVVQAQERRPASHAAVLGARRAGAAGPQVEIRVRDFGQGIPPEQVPLLFHRFVRLPRDLGSSVPGNGLGLYLCRVFAEAMGGSMHVESTGVPGEGSVFVLRLPRARGERYEHTAPLPATMQLQTGDPAERLHVGQAARVFVAADLQGQRIDLAAYRGRRVFLAFLRFAGCPFCGLRTHALTLRYPTFHAAGLEVLVVIESARSHALEQSVLCDAPFPIIADPTGALYRLYQTTTSQVGLQYALRHRKGELAAAQQQGLDGLVNDGPAHGDGVLDRLPAEFLIGSDGRIELAHYGKDIGDFLPLEILERHLR